MDYQNSLVAADSRTAITFSLSPGNAHDAPEETQATENRLGPTAWPIHLLMDGAWEGGRHSPVGYSTWVFCTSRSARANRISAWDVTEPCIGDATKLSACFAASKDFRRIFSPLRKTRRDVLGLYPFRSDRQSLRYPLA